MHRRQKTGGGSIAISRSGSPHTRAGEEWMRAGKSGKQGAGWTARTSSCGCGGRGSTTSRTDSSRISLHAWREAVWRVHHARHVFPRVGRGGAHRASLGTSGTAGGWKSGRGPSAFFPGTPFPPQHPAAHHSGFTRCAIPRTVPSRELSAGTPPAFSAARASPDRASGVRGGRLRCACGRTSAPGWGQGWRDRYLPENADGPLPR
jgi:hypothetical protein